MITVIRAGSGATAGPEAEDFTGDVWRDTLLPRQDGVASGDVYFTPGARSHWHTHEGGQLLLIRTGRGLVGDADGIVEVAAGDVVWTPPGVRHWHGAAPDKAMSHTAVSIRGVEWDAAVTDEEYAGTAGGA